MKKRTISALTTIAGAVVGAGMVGVKMDRQLSVVQDMSDKHLALFKMMNQWVRVKQEGKNLSEYLIDNGYKKIAIYGMSFAGETLLEELKNSDVKVEYGIDKNAKNMYKDVDIFTLEDNLKAVDAVVVTAITFFDEIEEVLDKKLNCPIISLEDVVYEV